MNIGLNAGIKALEAVRDIASEKTKGRWSSWYKVNESRQLIDKICSVALTDMLVDQSKALIPFQQSVSRWMYLCFGREISRDTVERNHRFLEEAIELVQACGCTQDEAHHLVRYVFSRPEGEKAQEVGGVMVTLAALCDAQDIDMDKAGNTELHRISEPVIMAKIREKQARKPKYSPLPEEASV